MLIHEAFTQWSEHFKPSIPEGDRPAMSEDWNNYTDALCKDGELTDLQYHYCPAFDDDMPQDADDERAYLLDQLGVTIESKPTEPTEDESDQWDDSAHHWLVTIKRGSGSMEIRFHMGAALTGKPDRETVINCAIMDWNSVEYADDFKEWAEENGFDTDSRRAERIYLARKAHSAEFSSFFADISIDDLAEAFEDF